MEERTKEQRKVKAARDERYRRETETSRVWFHRHEAELKAWFAQRLKIEQRIEPREPTLKDVEDFVRHQIMLYIQKHPSTNE